MAIAGLVYAGRFLRETLRPVERTHRSSVRLRIRLAPLLRAVIMLLATGLQPARQRERRNWLPETTGAINTGTFKRAGRLMPGIRR